MRINTRKALYTSLLATGLAATSFTASAVTVSTVGSFSNPTASSSYFLNIIANQDNDSTPGYDIPVNSSSASDSVAYFGWGIDITDTIITGEIIQSHFWFNGAGSVGGSPATVTPLGSAFSLGSFTYTNEQTVLSGGVVEIDFQLDINVDGYSLFPAMYTIEIDNTRTLFSNPPDVARLIDMPSDIAFMLGGSQYLLSFNGFSRDGGLTFETEAILAEGAQTSAEIFATITAVPVPAAIWLMGSGLLALVGFARSKK
ncbi:MAG: VPLPA-CTERM sorting domain-containing protein [Gammaproteobacteria bacterium]|nr:MAG: VPLPA-CTERM sorting domain-containing protein [Gammaproteobacteria bacterium]